MSARGSPIRPGRAWRPREPSRRGVLLACLLLMTPPARQALAASAGPAHPYAPTKTDSPARTSRAALRLAFPGALPPRGMLVVTGNLLSPLASWIILDLDEGTLRRAVTRLAEAGADGERAVLIESEATRALSDGEREEAIAAANEVWRRRDPDPPLLGEPTDRLCGIALFDGDDVLHEFASNCPRPGLAAVLEAMAASPATDDETPEPPPEAR